MIGTGSGAEFEATMTAVGLGRAAASALGTRTSPGRSCSLGDRSLAVETEHPIFGGIFRHGTPVALSETPDCVGPSCPRDQPSDSVLDELGLLAGRDRDAQAGRGGIRATDRMTRVALRG